MRNNSITLVLLLCLAGINVGAQEKPAAGAPQFHPGQSVYVIAVKSRAPLGRSLWQNLNRNQVKTGRGPIIHAPASDSRPTLERGEAERPTLERTVPSRRVLPPEEPTLKKLIEDEFLKQKNFTLASSPETADFIFFASAEYFHFESMRQGTSVAAIGLMTLGDDNLELNALAKLNIAAITATDYREWQSDIPHLFEKAKWQEEAWGEFRPNRDKPYEEPSAKKLVQKFHKQAVKK